MLTTTIIAAALAVAGSAGAVPTDSTISFQDRDLSASALTAGRDADAIEELEALSSKDPGQLINLGIAYARRGDEETARDLFQAALTSPQPIELETADGRSTDSIRLARKALRMLDNGEFAPASTTSRVTLRQ
jgi:tetratricopeptide (TPR) repeat protein